MALRRGVLPFAFALVALASVASFADDAPQTQPAASQGQAAERLTVRSRGRVTAPADEVDLEFVAESDSEDAKTAEKRHRNKLDGLLAALSGKDVEKTDDDEDGASRRKKHKAKEKDGEEEGKEGEEKPKNVLPEVGVPDKDGVVFDVREGRSTIGLLQNQNNQNGEDMPGEKKDQGANVAVGTAVHATLKNLSKTTPRKMRKLLAAIFDRATEGGACMGSLKTPVRPAIRFRPKDPDALSKKAYEEAMAKGRARAAELAKLAGRQLGKLTVVTELDAAQQAQPVAQDGLSGLEGMILTGDQIPSDAGASGSTEVAVEVVLQLEFELK